MNRRRQYAAGMDAGQKEAFDAYMETKGALQQFSSPLDMHRVFMKRNFSHTQGQTAGICLVAWKKRQGI